jgi:pimeloyl-ACP methyl ester carboxylesterase
MYCREEGSGKVIVLLHGFLETHAVWDNLSKNLSKTYKVISVDLPGFGKSALPNTTPFSISDIARLVLGAITADSFSLIGHSLGGYVALAMAEHAPTRVKSFGLFHSTAYADAPEKKEARTKTIDFVKRNGALTFTSNFIPPLFADPQHPAIPFATQLANQTKEDTVTQYLAAMRDRPDKTELLKNYGGHILFLAGLQDSVIPIDTVKKQAGMAKNPHFSTFDHVGHMGMFEAADETLKVVVEFLKE